MRARHPPPAAADRPLAAAPRPRRLPKNAQLALARRAPRRHPRRARRRADRGHRRAHGRGGRPGVGRGRLRRGCAIASPASCAPARLRSSGRSRGSSTPPATSAAGSSALTAEAVAPARRGRRGPARPPGRPGLVDASGAARLPDVVRYLQAAARRLDRLPDDPARDLDRMRAIEELEEAYGGGSTSGPPAARCPRAARDAVDARGAAGQPVRPGPRDARPGLGEADPPCPRGGGGGAGVGRGRGGQPQSQEPRMTSPTSASGCSRARTARWRRPTGSSARGGRGTSRSPRRRSRPRWSRSAGALRRRRGTAGSRRSSGRRRRRAACSGGRRRCAAASWPRPCRSPPARSRSLRRSRSARDTYARHAGPAVCRRRRAAIPIRGGRLPVARRRIRPRARVRRAAAAGGAGGDDVLAARAERRAHSRAYRNCHSRGSMSPMRARCSRRPCRVRSTSASVTGSSPRRGGIRWRWWSCRADDAGRGGRRLLPAGAAGGCPGRIEDGYRRRLERCPPRRGD